MDNKRHRDADNEAASASGKRARLELVASSASPGTIKSVAHQALFRSHGNDNGGRGGNGFLAVNSTGHVLPTAAHALDHRNSRFNDRASDHDGATSSTYANRNGSSASRTHVGSTITAVNDHAPLETMTDISRRFKQAVSTGWDRRSPTYADANVLLLYWKEDSSEVKEATRRLESVFRHSFNYATEVFSIPSTNAEQELNSAVEAFFDKNNTPDKLAILHYAGRCLASEIPGAPPIWMPRHDGADIIVESGTIESAYNGSLCDVLLLLDHNCIRHPHYTKNPLGSARRKVVEVVDAPPVESEQAHISFTKALADELAAVAYGDSLLVETLHRQVAARMTIHKPRGRGRPPKEPVARPIADQQHLPNHYYLQECRSIVLAPIPNEPQVVLCIRVLNGAPDVSRWAQWIYDADPKARNSVQFEGLYSGFSTMIVLRVPTAEWEYFPECPAGSLVGYTTIGDIPSDLLEKIDAGLSTKLWIENEPSLPLGDPPTPANVAAAASYLPSSAANLASFPNSSTNATDRLETLATGIDSDFGPKKVRKALPTERKILPSGPGSLPAAHRRIEQTPVTTDRPVYRPPQHNIQQQQEQQRISQQELSRQLVESGLSERDALLVAAAQKPFKISIKLAGQNHMCNECKAGFKDIDSLRNHVRKQHTRPFHCVFNWAGCESTFASKNEWKRHVMSQHILLHYWVCQVELCSKVVNKAPGAAHSSFSLPNGAIFNRKDLFTQHLRRMHTPTHVRKLLKQAKMTNKTANHPAILEWENRMKELQQDGIKPRCRLPDFMICPSLGCGVEFHGNGAWDDRMEHVARHLEGAAAGRETLVSFGGKSDPTLTNWATRPEVGIAKRVGPDAWHLDNPLRPEIREWTGNDGDDDVADIPSRDQADEHILPSSEHLQQEEDHQDKDEAEQHDSPSDGRSSRERSKSVIEVAVPHSPLRDDTTDHDPEKNTDHEQISDPGQTTEEDVTKDDGGASPKTASEEQQRPSRERSTPNIVVRH